VNRDDRPIGWWLRRADDLISGSMDRTLDGAGITRSHWQLMNAVRADEAATRATVQSELRDFLDEQAVDRVVADLDDRGWIEDLGSTLRLTPEGEEALGDIGREIAGFRERMSNGVSADDYATTMRTLARMVDNLEGG
jgi:DNA-binding MarR family transcriptional regulator